MDKGRRGFLKGGAAGAAGVTGWLLFGKGAKADEKAEGNRVIREFDEEVDGIPHHVIEMQLTYDNPMLQFDVPPPEPVAVPDRGFLGSDREAVFNAIERKVSKRQTVARHTATELLHYEGAVKEGGIWEILRKRVARLKKAPTTQTPQFVTTVVCHCPSNIEVGMTITPVKVTLKEMHLTVPATLLPQG